MENNNPNQTNNQQPDNTPSIYPTPTETPIENIQPIASQLTPQAVHTVVRKIIIQFRPTTILQAITATMLPFIALATATR
jgi:hypothetical protein